MQLNHLNLVVRDVVRSATFWETHFGFEPVRHLETGGVMLASSEGSVLVFEPGHPAPDPGSVFHVGFGLADADAVLSARKRLQEAGVRELDWVQEEGYRSVKVADPDGYVVEVFWEA